MPQNDQQAGESAARAPEQWRIIESSYEVGVAITRGDQTDPAQDVARHLKRKDAERIVRCVSSHDALVAALRQIVDAVVNSGQSGDWITGKVHVVAASALASAEAA